MELSTKQKLFSQFLVPFLKSTSNFEHFAKKGEPYVFPNYGLPKTRLGKRLTSLVPEHPLTINRSKGPKLS